MTTTGQEVTYLCDVACVQGEALLRLLLLGQAPLIRVAAILIVVPSPAQQPPSACSSLQECPARLQSSAVYAERGKGQKHLHGGYQHAGCSPLLHICGPALRHQGAPGGGALALALEGGLAQLVRGRHPREVDVGQGHLRAQAPHRLQPRSRSCCSSVDPGAASD